ncbi:DUF6502 family protein [Roseibium sp. HPY-6]|uniref:DUF6502 family protein n=1 Tax=Roseibium sp. HPY-6 TaxID=3229852 RepID=UPI0033906B3B
MSTGPKDPFEIALADLLIPLAKAMVARGVTVATATEALKKSLVTAAEESSEDGLSDSKVSALTGIHRKDVKRLRSDEETVPAKRSCSAAALIIGYWSTSPEFQSENNAPRELSRKSKDGQPGFDDLVRLARIDMAPGTVLQTLLDQKLISALADGTYRLLGDAFVPTAGSAEQVAAYRATLSAHLAAATHNLIAGDDTPRHFDRAVRYSHLSAASVEELRALSSEKAQQFLQTINAKARQLQDRDEDDNQTGRFVAGTYILPTLPEDKEG